MALNTNRPLKAMAEGVPKDQTQSFGNWQVDQQAGYVAHYLPPDDLYEGIWDGPDDAFVWLGQPFEGNPNKDERFNIATSKWERCEAYVDTSGLSVEIGGIPVQWVAWDQKTCCNVYKRLPVQTDSEPAKRGPGRPKTEVTE